MCEPIVQWKHRFAVLTNDQMLFSREDRKHVVDMINFKDIELTELDELIENDEHDHEHPLCVQN